MIITQADPEFRPVTIVIETQDEFDKLMAIIATVAENKVNHMPQVIRAAIDLLNTVSRLERDES